MGALLMVFLAVELFPELIAFIQAAVNECADAEKLKGRGEFALLEQFGPMVPFSFKGGEAVLRRDNEIDCNDHAPRKMGKRGGDQIADN